MCWQCISENSSTLYGTITNSSLSIKRWDAIGQITQPITATISRMHQNPLPTNSPWMWHHIIFRWFRYLSMSHLYFVSFKLCQFTREEDEVGRETTSKWTELSCVSSPALRCQCVDFIPSSTKGKNFCWQDTSFLTASLKSPIFRLGKEESRTKSTE